MFDSRDPLKVFEQRSDMICEREQCCVDWRRETLGAEKPVRLLQDLRDGVQSAWTWVLALGPEKRGKGFGGGEVEQRLDLQANGRGHWEVWSPSIPCATHRKKREAVSSLFRFLWRGGAWLSDC